MRIYSRFSDECIFKVILFIFITSFILALLLCQNFFNKLEIYNTLAVSCLYSKDIECLSATLFNIIGVKETILYVTMVILSITSICLGIILSIIINSIKRSK